MDTHLDTLFYFFLSFFCLGGQVLSNLLVGRLLGIINDNNSLLWCFFSAGTWGGPLSDFWLLVGIVFFVLGNIRVVGIYWETPSV